MLTLLLDGVAIRTIVDGVAPSLGAVYLALFAHVLLTVYDGTFGRARTLSWCILLLIWFAAELGQFLGFIIPWGQASYWAAAMLYNTFGEQAATWIGALLQGTAISSVAAHWTTIVAAALALDLALMRRQTMWQLAGLVGLAVAAGFAMDAAVGSAMPSPAELEATGPFTPVALLSPWYLLPVYAVIRSVPDKLGGVLVGGASLLAFLAVPWHRADRLRTQAGTWRLWGLLCLALAAAWAGLGYVGANRPETPWLEVGRALVAFHFAMLLVVPFALRVRRSGY